MDVWLGASPYPSPGNLAETHDVGPDTWARITSHLDFPILLEKYGIIMGGHTVTRRGNLFIRKNPVTTQMLVCCSGEAVALIDDRWVTLSPGMAYITPRKKQHAYFASPGKEMEFSWVIFEGDGPESIRSYMRRDQPYIISVDPNLLSFPLLGLYNETIHLKDELTMESWVQLVITYTRRALAGNELDPRLRRLWIAVEADISRDWTCESLASIARVSEEHLRRLCHLAYGLSPIKRLYYLRLRLASELLAYTELGMEQIAERTGYSDAATLSRAFSRNRGISPARYRRQMRLNQ